MAQQLTVEEITARLKIRWVPQDPAWLSRGVPIQESDNRCVLLDFEDRRTPVASPSRGYVANMFARHVHDEAPTGEPPGPNSLAGEG